MNEGIFKLSFPKLITKNLKKLTNLKRCNYWGIEKFNYIDGIYINLYNNIYNTDVQTSNILNNIVKENEATFNLKIQLEIANSLLEQLQVLLHLYL